MTLTISPTDPPTIRARLNTLLLHCPNRAMHEARGSAA